LSWVRSRRLASAICVPMAVSSLSTSARAGAGTGSTAARGSGHTIVRTRVGVPVVLVVLACDDDVVTTVLRVLLGDGAGARRDSAPGVPVPVSAVGPSDVDVVGGGSVLGGTVIPGGGDESMRTNTRTRIITPAIAAHSARCDTGSDSSGSGRVDHRPHSQIPPRRGWGLTNLVLTITYEAGPRSSVCPLRTQWTSNLDRLGSRNGCTGTFPSLSFRYVREIHKAGTIR
jgi:hypothetical protein